MTEQRRSRVYARRRDLRAAPSTAAPPDPLPLWPDGGSGGPTTQELELYRREPALPERVWAGKPADGDRGDRARAFVERWSLWAAGLGRPPRDARGRRRYPGREGMLPPALLIAAGLGVAGLVGLLTGVLVSGPAGAAAAASTVPPTQTVTQPVAQPAVTITKTHTRTRTTTVTATRTVDPQPANAGGLQPGAQGPAVAQLQQDLAALGLFQGPPNGSYDEPTRAAVQNFQARFDIAGDPPGVAGQATQAALAKALGRG